MATVTHVPKEQGTAAAMARLNVQGKVLPEGMLSAFSHSESDPVSLMQQWTVDTQLAVSTAAGHSAGAGVCHSNLSGEKEA